MQDRDQQQIYFAAPVLAAKAESPHVDQLLRQMSSKLAAARSFPRFLQRQPAQAGRSLPNMKKNADGSLTLYIALGHGTGASQFAYRPSAAGAPTGESRR